jgi:hypothetical protein
MVAIADGGVRPLRLIRPQGIVTMMPIAHVCIQAIQLQQVGGEDVGGQQFMKTHPSELALYLGAS